MCTVGNDNGITSTALSLNAALLTNPRHQQQQMMCASTLLMCTSSTSLPILHFPSRGTWKIHEGHGIVVVVVVVVGVVALLLLVVVLLVLLLLWLDGVDDPPHGCVLACAFSRTCCL